jgi:hypothetical protein
MLTDYIIIIISGYLDCTLSRGKIAERRIGKTNHFERNEGVTPNPPVPPLKLRTNQGGGNFYFISIYLPSPLAGEGWVRADFLRQAKFHYNYGLAAREK